jgi:5-formyltetrahydrofolate cyclo-ligase
VQYRKFFMPKRSLRSQLLAQRRALDPDTWLTASSAAQRNLLSLAEYARADCVALYAAAHNEIDTGLILTEALQAGKRVLYPAVCGHQMVFRTVTRREELREGRFGILEPHPSGVDHHADEADLIVVPGVCFDLTGHRIGYGKGYYDRFLHHPGRTAHLVGLCHDFQLTDGPIPVDQHDIPMEIIVSESRVIRIAPVADAEK